MKKKKHPVLKVGDYYATIKSDDVEIYMTRDCHAWDIVASISKDEVGKILSLPDQSSEELSKAAADRDAQIRELKDLRTAMDTARSQINARISSLVNYNPGTIEAAGYPASRYGKNIKFGCQTIPLRTVKRFAGLLK